MDFCLNCAFKHVAKAKEIFNELRMGYADDVEHIAAFVGNLSLAEDHLVDKHPELANLIRDERTQYEAGLTIDLTYVLNKVYELKQKEEEYGEESEEREDLKIGIGGEIQE